MTVVPSAAELRKLPLRAVVAFAFRCAKRAAREMGRAVPEGRVAEALSLMEKLASGGEFNQMDGVSLLRAGAEVVGSTAASTAQPPVQALLSFTSAALTAYAAIEAALDETGADDSAAYAARQAEAAARTLSSVDEARRAALVEALRRDYEILRTMCGEYDVITIGEPIDLSEESAFGPTF